MNDGMGYNIIVYLVIVIVGGCSIGGQVIRQHIGGRAGEMGGE